MPEKKLKHGLRWMEPGETGKESTKVDPSAFVGAGGGASSGVKAVKVASAIKKAPNPARGLMVKEGLNYFQSVIGAKLGQDETKEGNISVSKTKERARGLVAKVKAAKKALF